MSQDDQAQLQAVATLYSQIPSHAIDVRSADAVFGTPGSPPVFAPGPSSAPAAFTPGPDVYQHEPLTAPVDVYHPEPHTAPPTYHTAEAPVVLHDPARHTGHEPSKARSACVDLFSGVRGLLILGLLIATIALIIVAIQFASPSKDRLNSILGNADLTVTNVAELVAAAHRRGKITIDIIFDDAKNTQPIQVIQCNGTHH
jgi:hypothetical protein